MMSFLYFSHIAIFFPSKNKDCGNVWLLRKVRKSEKGFGKPAFKSETTFLDEKI